MKREQVCLRLLRKLKKNSVLYLEMFILFYADGTVILAESANDLQFALNELYKYCDIWKLTVNISKTKIVLFCKGRQPKCLFL